MFRVFGYIGFRFMFGLYSIVSRVWGSGVNGSGFTTPAQFGPNTEGAAAGYLDVHG